MAEIEEAEEKPKEQTIATVDKNFNPGAYRFKKGVELNTEQDLFRQKFYEHKKANKLTIN